MFTVGGRSYVNEEDASRRIEEIDAENRDSYIDPASEVGREWNALNQFVDQMRGRRARLAELATDPRHREETFEPPQRRRDPGPLPLVGRASAERTGGLRTVERYHDSGHLHDGAADTLDRLVRDPRDPHAMSARYLVAVGGEHYLPAVGKYIEARFANDTPIFTDEEHRAWLAVKQVEAERALQTGVGSAGGFALPIVIDPSIMLTALARSTPSARSPA